MKTNLTLLSIVPVVTACLFAHTALGSTPQITMTTESADRISITLIGSGTAAVNWGDGTIQKYTLEDGEENIIAHDYETVAENTKTIVITGMILLLDCSVNDLTSLDVSGCTALLSLDCSVNELTSLDVSKNTTLIELDCSDNELTSLDVSGCTALLSLDCSGNELTSLDVSKNTTLIGLDCSGNELTSLGVSGCTALTQLDCSGNELTAAALNALFGTLNRGNNKLTTSDVIGNKEFKNMLKEMDTSWDQLTTEEQNTLLGVFVIYSNKIGSLSIDDNPGEDDCDLSIAAFRGWEVE